MRIKNSVKNIYISLITQLVVIALGFISRKVFLDSLGTEYLGVNGLLTNVLSMLSLVEGGIGVSIVYNLYKPLAEKDEPKIIALVQLYKKIYGILAIIIFALSILIYPMVNILVTKDTKLPYISIVYFLFVLQNMISYLNAHKWSLINADQRGYEIAKYNIVFKILTVVSQIIILKLTDSYIFFLITESVVFIAQNIYNGRIVNRLYPYIKTKSKYKVDEGTKKNLIINVKALFLHNIGTYCVFGTDNLLISAFINIKTVGIYSNYTMITTQMSLLSQSVLNNIGHSVGNLIATENKEKVYSVFNIIYFINFAIYSIAVIFLYNLLEPFINLWLGDGLLLDKFTFIVILLNFYINGLRNSISTFKSKAGIFDNDKYIPLIESVVNLGASIILVKYFGLAGIFIGTTISTIAFPLWIQSNLVYKNVFEKPISCYFKKYIFYIFLTIITCFITTKICNSITLPLSFFSLIVKGIVCIFIPSIIYTIVFFKTYEFKYIFELLKSFLRLVKSKVVFNR